MLNSVLTLFADLLHWVHDNKVTAVVLVLISIITFIGTLAAVPFMLIRLPSNYFSHDRKRREPGITVNPLIRIVMLVAKNILGYIIILTGVAMLVLPGQGILTILVGIMLVDFPGKFHLERRLVSQPKVLHAVNWLRRRAGKAELVLK